ncbi:DUF4190 domain-containing protein [Desmospora profundinema]|uniref:DUF4190 domain-containing protein n=1 Tax=Desmospora profundinema TaxID=1571184 RepID=A0ABU1IJN4_9BACL|nr:DUF4190 domain-containing protein [Desmospora profundinema]MDR6224990.1 hypothetical protein [Desmospora profundinema]
MAHHKKKKKNNRNHQPRRGNEAGIDRAADEVEFADEPGAVDLVRVPGLMDAADDVEFGEEAMAEHRDDRILDAREAFPADEHRGYGDVEAATEVAPVAGPIERERERDDRSPETRDAGRGMGIFSLVLSVLSFFMVPFLLGPAAIVLGIISARRGNRLGVWAVGLGAVSIILTAFIAPIAGF